MDTQMPMSSQICKVCKRDDRHSDVQFEILYAVRINDIRDVRCCSLDCALEHGRAFKLVDQDEHILSVTPTRELTGEESGKLREMFHRRQLRGDDQPHDQVKARIGEAEWCSSPTRPTGKILEAINLFRTELNPPPESGLTEPPKPYATRIKKYIAMLELIYLQSVKSSQFRQLENAAEEYRDGPECAPYLQAVNETRTGIRERTATVIEELCKERDEMVASEEQLEAEREKNLALRAPLETKVRTLLTERSMTPETNPKEMQDLLRWLLRS